MQLVSKGRETESRLLRPAELRLILEPTRWKILKLLAERPMFPREVAKELNLDEQLVHYHFNQLRRSGVVHVVRTEARRGATARFFEVRDNAFAVLLRDAWTGAAVPDFLSPFYRKGRFDAKIVVGSPDPHGPHNARARDAFYAVDLALFFGSLCERAEPCVRLDTEIREGELRDNNLVIVGGPIVNLVESQVNESLPVRIKTGAVNTVFSAKTGKSYGDPAGFVARAPSHWNPERSMLVVAGNSFAGTKAAILAVMTESKQITREAHVFVGLDLDGDGMVDAVELKE